MEYDHWPKDNGLVKTKEVTVDNWEKWRGRFDGWRVIPRLLIALYGWMCYNVADWFMALPEPSMAQVTFVSTVWGAAAAWFGFYVNSGHGSSKSASADGKE
jgi:hypothetical protein